MLVDVKSTDDADTLALLLDYRLVRSHGKCLSSHVVGCVISFLSQCCVWSECPVGRPFVEGEAETKPTRTAIARNRRAHDDDDDAEYDDDDDDDDNYRDAYMSDGDDDVDDDA